MALEIREMRAEDAESLAAMHVATWLAAYGDLVPAGTFEGLDLAEQADRWRGRVDGAENVGRRTIVALDGPAVAGFVAVGVAREAEPPGVGELYALYVESPRWGTGLGRRLMDAGLAALVDAGYAAAYLWVLQDNPRARRFYELAGWACDGTVKDVDLFGTTLPEVRYRRSMADSPASTPR
ncbi:MAG TPA: GNAT family N-acetyltransferase [Mycobacteriales bacterium]|nr:GNAT family N-acetyltransferase [Mycobacteriales bacterium]